ncbi:MAG: hypothetical protein DCC75_00180 [Proteobacteria bacterium]|nr:MAG: hypothetical protein DCC75_00180 [Pseudomonadota bacterium]
MRVLAITGTSDRSEIGLFCGLKQAGVELKVILDPDSPYLSILEESGVATTRAAFRRRFCFGSLKFLKEELRLFNPEIMHAFTSRALSHALLLKGKRNVVAYRGTSGHLSRLNPWHWLTYFNPALCKIICVSNSVRKYLLSSGLPESKLAVVYKGHDQKWYADSRQASLDEFGIPSGAKVICCIANMRPVKGVQYLIEAFSMIDRAEVFLLLVGEVRDKNLIDRANASPAADCIKFAGYRKDSASILRASSIFVMPSIDREGLPKAMIEAVMADVPLVVTNVGGMPEIIRNNIDGLVVPPKDSRTLAAALKRLLEDSKQAQDFADSARQRANELLSVECMVNATRDIYESLLRSK